MEEVKFKEEYWGDAMSVLKREERKAAIRKYAPLLLLLLLIVGAGSMYTISQQGEPSQAGTITEKNELAQDFSRADKAENSIESGVEESEEIVSIASENESNNNASSIRANKSVAESDTNIEKTIGLEEENENDAIANNEEIQLKNETLIEKADSDSEKDIRENDNTELNEPVANIEDEQAEDDSKESPETSVEESILYVGNENFPTNSFEAAVAELHLMSSIDRLSIGNKTKHSIKENHYDVNRPFPVKVSQLSLVLGNSFLTGFGSRKGDLFFNPELGLSYENVFTEKWSASASLTYFQVSGVVHNAEFYQTQLDFGYHTTLTQVNTEKLHFAYLPLQFTHNFNKRNALSAGVGFSYLINSESIVTISEIDNFGEKELDQYSQWGYLDGYKPINASLLLGYEFRLTPVLAFEVDYQYGLSKITRSNVYEQVSEDRNSRLRVMLKYQIKAKA